MGLERSNQGGKRLSVGYSPCPNDTFIFHALVTGRVPASGLRWAPRLEDVETLNRLAFDRVLPVTKLSFHAYGHLRPLYALLSSGAALGRGCGPLLVARSGGDLREWSAARIAIPGKWTTAALLLQLFAPDLASGQLIEMPFDRILEQVAGGACDAGLIIHESRFTYRDHGLVALEDLGAWWERKSGLPIPLGCIAAVRTLGPETLRAVEEALHASVVFARRNRAASAEYVRRHAQELSPAVIEAHIDLYVNEFTEDLGKEGRRAVRALLEAAEDRGLVPREP